jgi:hypothetical protein
MVPRYITKMVPRYITKIVPTSITKMVPTSITTLVPTYITTLVPTCKIIIQTYENVSKYMVEIQEKVIYVAFFISCSL